MSIEYRGWLVARGAWHHAATDVEPGYDILELFVKTVEKALVKIDWDTAILF